MIILKTMVIIAACLLMLVATAILIIVGFDIAQYSLLPAIREWQSNRRTNK